MNQSRWANCNDAAVLPVTEPCRELVPIQEVGHRFLPSMMFFRRSEPSGRRSPLRLQLQVHGLRSCRDGGTFPGGGRQSRASRGARLVASTPPRAQNPLDLTQLDTDACLYALKRRGPIIDRRRGCSPHDLAVSIITVAELWFGARKDQRPDSNRRSIDAFLKPFEIFPFDLGAAEACAELRFALERIGRPIGERDLQIASIAVARRRRVMTHNISEFARVPGLSVKDWARDLPSIL
jgi:tRNA(fMet)-specific endonuclease VapC